MSNKNPELIAKAKAAKTAEELIELAKDNNVELTEEEAKTYFEQLNANGAVADDELDAVAGGGSCPFEDNPCPKCGGETKPISRAMRECLTCGYQFG